MVKHILIATKNAGKAREFKKLFSEKGIEVKTLLDMENTPEIDENGKTFTENALIKAQTLTDLYKIPVLADDSGIVVDYLNGGPTSRIGSLTMLWAFQRTGNQSVTKSSQGLICPTTALFWLM